MLESKFRIVGKSISTETILFLDKYRSMKFFRKGGGFRKENYVTFRFWCEISYVHNSVKYYSDFGNLLEEIE